MEIGKHTLAWLITARNSMLELPFYYSFDLFTRMPDYFIAMF